MFLSFKILWWWYARVLLWLFIVCICLRLGVFLLLSLSQIMAFQSPESAGMAIHIRVLEAVIFILLLLFSIRFPLISSIWSSYALPREIGFWGIPLPQNTISSLASLAAAKESSSQVCDLRLSPRFSLCRWFLIPYCGYWLIPYHVGLLAVGIENFIACF